MLPRPSSPELDLEAAVKPANMPAWITQQYLEACAADRKLQRNWEPKDGDWFYCTALHAVVQIADAAPYGDENSTVDTEEGSKPCGLWPCDTYLPDPNAVA